MAVGALLNVFLEEDLKSQNNSLIHGLQNGC